MVYRFPVVLPPLPTVLRGIKIFLLVVFMCFMMTQQSGKPSEKENTLLIECLLHFPNF